MTGNGLVVLAVGLLAGGAWYLGYPGAAPIAVAAAMLVFAALGWRLVARRSGELRLAVAPARVHRGDAVTVRAGGLRGPGYGHAVVLGEKQELPVPREWHATADRRGRYESRFTHGERVGVLCLARRRMPGSPPVATTVLPRRYPFAVVRSATLGVPGSTGLDQGGTVFANLREYVDGDDARFVNWPASARTHDGSLLVRQHLLSQALAFRLVLDPDPGAGPEDFETAVDIAYSLAVAVPSPVLVTAAEGRPVTATGLASVESRLTTVEPCPRHPYGSGEACPNPLLRNATGGTVTVVVSAAARPTTAWRQASILFQVGLPVAPRRLGALTVFPVPDLAAAARAWAGVVSR